MLSNGIYISKKLLTGLLIFFAVAGIIGGYALLGNSVIAQTTISDSTSKSPTISGSQSLGQTSLSSTQTNTQQQNKSSDAVKVAPQDIYIHANAGGTYDINSISVKAGVPVRLHFTADPNAGCGRQLVIYGLNVVAVSVSGEEKVVEFTPSKLGVYDYSCGMRMWGPGKLVVQ